MNPDMLGTLEPVDLRTVWTDEARKLTPWLSKPENLERLSKALDLELELEGTEMLVGPFKADLVANETSTNSRVIIENQLEKTNHDHLGKIITYASGLDAKVIIWIAKEFSEEHRRAIDFLNENAAPNLRIFGIEIQLWRIGDSPAAPLFKVISSPNDYTSNIRVIEEKQLTSTASLYLEFWTKFKEYCQKRRISLRLQKPQPQHWFTIAIARSNFTIGLTASV